MKCGSPLKKCWTPGMDDEESHYLIVIDDSVNTCCFFNYIFNNISRYTYENRDDNVIPLQRYFFWKNIRGFIEFHYKRILKENLHDMRIILLSGNLYEYVCYQENMFEKIDL
jgi:hypothetical protein